jgi:hypothetical protein
VGLRFTRDQLTLYLADGFQHVQAPAQEIDPADPPRLAALEEAAPVQPR